MSAGIIADEDNKMKLTTLRAKLDPQKPSAENDLSALGFYMLLDEMNINLSVGGEQGAKNIWNSPPEETTGSVGGFYKHFLHPAFPR